MLTFELDQPVTAPDEHLHGIVVQAYPTGYARVRWADGTTSTIWPDDDLLTDETQCGEPTRLGPCTDMALPGDEHCHRHGGCESA